MSFIFECMMCTDSGCIDCTDCTGKINAFFDRPVIEEGVGKGAEAAVTAAGCIDGFDLIRIGEEAFFLVFEEAAFAAELQQNIFDTAGKEVISDSIRICFTGDVSCFFEAWHHIIDIRIGSFLGLGTNLKLIVGHVTDCESTVRLGALQNRCDWFPIQSRNTE